MSQDSSYEPATFLAAPGTSGYYRFPTLNRNQVVFVAEDDLWTVELKGGIARRLSSGLGKVRWPSLSHDGKWLAFSSTEEGHSETFVMASEGGEATRLTYLGSDTRVVGWTPAGEVLFASHHEEGFAKLTNMYAIGIDGRKMRKIPCGPATHLDFDAKGRMVIARHGGTDLAHWKRYRGGTAGELWIDRNADGKFAKLLAKPANSARPYWAGGRVVFISDFEGIGNVYSVKDDGSDLKRHTDCREYYARGLSVRGTSFIYHSGGDIFTGDIGSDVSSDVGSGLGQPQRVAIEYRSPRTQLNRRFVSATRYLEDFELHPHGEKAVIAARGKTFSFDLWKGPVFMHGEEGALRYRLGRFLNDGKRIALVCDAGGEESLEIHEAQGNVKVVRLTGLNLGRTLDMKLSPTGDEAVITNHRSELIWINLVSGAVGTDGQPGKQETRVLDRSEHDSVGGFNWSPDGRWIAYSCSDTPRTRGLRICEVKTGKVHRVTTPILHDVNPFFDPSGEYLYFLSYREFDPVYDNMHFDLSFPRGCRPYLLTLRKNVLSPFSSDHPGRSN